MAISVCVGGRVEKGVPKEKKTMFLSKFLVCRVSLTIPPYGT